jgi:hypothetical protein
MTFTSTFQPSRLTASLPEVLLLATRMQAGSPVLYVVGMAMLLMAAMMLALAWLDPRLFQGVSTWAKPLKFQLSTGVYVLTLAWFMAWLPADKRQSRLGRYVVWSAVGAGIFEVVYITWQGAFGLASHFNYAPGFYSTMYTLMGVGAVILTTASLALAVLIARSPGYALPPAIKQAVVLGLVLTFVLGTGFGSYLGAQRTGHWVGGALTDAGGLPLLNWSRTGGDLRVAHFFGIHAMHFVPAIAALAAAARLSGAKQVASAWLVAAVFSVLTVWTFVQAAQGKPFLPGWF